MTARLTSARASVMPSVRPSAPVDRGRRLLLGMPLVLAAAGIGAFEFGSALAGQAAAEDALRIATSYRLMTLDPHYANLNENNSLLSHIYERLIYQDEHLALTPALALAWQAVSDRRWQFKLRPDVRFHDGSAFTADDVIYSIDRIRTFLQPPGEGFRAYVAGISAVSAPDPLTVVIDTDRPVPNLPLAFSSIFIMHRPQSSESGGSTKDGFITTEALNAGTGPVGTGPYRFVSWTSGEALKLARNDTYRGTGPAWPTVDIRVIDSPAARVAALAAGDVDLADAVPARDVAALKARGIRVNSIGAARANFLQFDVSSDVAPGVTARSGEPIGNPFKNPLVRRALALAVDRAVLVDRILAGYATPAAQFFPDGLPGTSAKLKPEAADYVRAKALLVEAGYPDGFTVELAGSAGRYPGDGESLQAVAQSWARIGVRVRPSALPFSVFNTRRAAGAYAVWYGGCSGEAVDIILDALLASPDPRRGLGALNFGHYSNAAFDRALSDAEGLQAGAQRDAALGRAAELAIADQPIIPLYHFHHIVGFAGGARGTVGGTTGGKIGSYVMHPRGWTTAMQAMPVDGPVMAR